jgi:hypothetical protein
VDRNSVDERLIRRGELLLSLEFVDGCDGELRTMNRGKVGRPYVLTEMYAEFLSVVRYLFGFPYRQLEGFTRALHTLVPDLPPGDYSGLRKRILRLSVDPYKSLKETDEPITIAVDSTGVKVNKAGGWVERKHRKKSRYVKLHFAVNTVTHEVVAMEVSTDESHDVEALPGLVEGSGRRVRVAEVLGDGAYDSSSVYELLERLGVEAVIKPRRNGRSDRGHPGRRRAVELVKRLGYDGWARLTGYGRRWAAETAYSTFKRLFGEHSLARDIVNIARGLTGKVALYNMLVNM